MDEPAKKKVKKKEVYCRQVILLVCLGVNQKKFYDVIKDTDACDTINKLGGETDFLKREEVFSKNRKVLPNKFR